MRFVLSGALLAFVSLLLLIALGAARPFDRLPGDSPAYDHLAAIEEAGLLSGFEMPAGELSRLEAAVLVQHALGAYGVGQLGGGDGDGDVEAALSELLTEFAAELEQLGTSVALPASADGVVQLERRVSYLEEELDDVAYDVNETYLDQLYGDPCVPCGEDAEGCDDVEVSLYGDVYLQLRGESISYEADDGYESSDLDVYWGELGVDASDGLWSGHFSVMLDDETDEVRTHEYYARYDHPSSGFYTVAGRAVLPFGNNDFYFPTYPAANDLGYTTADTVGFGWDEPRWGLSGWLYNPGIEVGDEEDHFTDYAFVWDVTRREADPCHDGWRVTAGYNSHLANHDIALASAGSVVDRNEAVNFFGRYDFNRNRCHLLAEITHSMDEFNVADLDADGDGVGDQPCALNSEFVYEPCPDQLWGVSFQHTCQVADFAENRFGLLWGRRLSQLAMLKLEYTHGEYGDFATAGQDSDDTLVAEINIAF